MVALWYEHNIPMAQSHVPTPNASPMTLFRRWIATVTPLKAVSLLRIHRIYTSYVYACVSSSHIIRIHDTYR